MKLCFSTLGCSDRSLDEILSLAKSYQTHAIEIRGIGGTLNNREIEAFFPTNLQRTLQKFESAGIFPSVLGTSCSFHREEKFEAAIMEGVGAIRIASALGIPFIRVFGDKLLPNEKEACVDRIVKGLHRLCQEDERVTVLLEIHGDFNTEETLLPVLDSMSRVKNFGLIWDIEHTHQSYGNRWLSFYKFARPYIKHVHIKDYSNARKSLTLIGDGDIPIAEIVAQLIKDGYNGYLSLEWEKKWHPELPDIETALLSFITLIERTEKRS